MGELIKATFYMKSGNSFNIKMKSCEWEKEDNCITSLTWVGIGTKALNYISLDQIEAIVSEVFEE